MAGADVDWRMGPDGNFLVMDAMSCPRDWNVFHEVYAPCAVHAVRGRAPRIHYRHWSYDGAPGVVQLFEPGEPHRCLVKDGSGDFSVLMIPVHVLHGAARELGADPAVLHFDRAVAAEPYAAIRDLAVMLACPAPDPLQLDVRFRECLRLIVAQSSAQEKERYDDESIQRAVDYLSELATRPRQGPVRLKEVASSCGAKGPSVLCRDFKELTGYSPYEYYKLRTLEWARLKLETGRSVKAVAEDCGYSGEAFSREFRRCFGVTAREYQWQHRRVTRHPPPPSS